jgi:hypothetical protein
MNPFVLRVRGETISLRSQGAAPGADQAIRLVQDLIEDAEERLPATAPSHHLLLLALCDLAEEYLSAKERTALHREEVLRRILELRQASLPAGNTQ